MVTVDTGGDGGDSDDGDGDGDGLCKFDDFFLPFLRLVGIFEP